MINMSTYKILGILISIIFLGFLIQSFPANSVNSISVNFSVTSSGYVTVYLHGINENSEVDLYWGIEPYPQGPYYTLNGTPGAMETPMTWNNTINAFQVTVGPFNNGTWIAWDFLVNGTQFINYDNHPFWNWNLIVNPPSNELGKTYAVVLSNGSILITALGRPPDVMILHYGLASGPETGLPWSNISNANMTYNPLYGNYTVIIGPFKPGQWVQWVYYDQTLNEYLHNNTYYNFDIQDVYTPLTLITSSFNEYVYTENETVNVTITLRNNGPTAQYGLQLFEDNMLLYSNNLTLSTGINNVSITFPAHLLSQGIYDSTLNVIYHGLIQTYTLPQLYILNTTGKKPLSLVIDWNMHQPLYIEPNGSYGQPWVPIHTGQDFYYNGSLVGSYELQALLLNYFKNINISIDFTGVLLYQWEAFLHNENITIINNEGYNINITHDYNATLRTIELYRNLVKEGRLQVLTVSFYHPLMAIEYDNGWSSDLLAQILMGENMTNYVFGVKANAAWTPEMAFNMGLIQLYNETGINVTLLDWYSFVQIAPDLTVVKGNVSSPYQVYEVENSLGQTIYVLFRDTNLSNMFSFSFFSQSPQLTSEELLQYLARVYMSHPGGIDVVALDGENPLIFNPTTGPADLYAIYNSISTAEGQGWLETQTINQALATHKVGGLLTNLPEESWDTNLNDWNNGYQGKIEIWDNVSEARTYLVAYSNLLGLPLSPVVPLSFTHAPNATNLNLPPAYQMYYTLWNYLYVSEGSDWTWQAGPPNYGPQWFAIQPIVYDHAIINYVNNSFSQLNLANSIITKNVAILNIQNGLGVNANIIVAIAQNNSIITYKQVTLLPGLNVVLLNYNNIKAHNLTVEFYVNVNNQELGAHIIPITQLGLLISKYNVSTLSFNPNANISQSKANTTHQNNENIQRSVNSSDIDVISMIIVLLAGIAFVLTQTKKIK
ncbi:glycoside hydrolase [Acidianus manzaensis]|uniref:Glycoside hydrolase family 57 N-terminal domain-containing protein n=1 Tax=Acidianus manzaensis TaxID=282676 RepID=A0A1W6JWJ3_9CREN|nr:glycoside hydrolase [Acidianus manzaensis]ARM74612.1 hypothetical protein B6F84_00260 [Acidianus manzaensis]